MMPIAAVWLAGLAANGGRYADFQEFLLVCAILAGIFVLGLVGLLLARRLALRKQLKSDVSRTLEKLQETFNKGLISHEEFDRCRRAMLGLSPPAETKQSHQSPEEPQAENSITDEA